MNTAELKIDSFENFLIFIGKELSRIQQEKIDENVKSLGIKKDDLFETADYNVKVAQAEQKAKEAMALEVDNIRKRITQQHWESFVKVESHDVLIVIKEDLTIKIPRFCSFGLVQRSRYIIQNYHNSSELYNSDEKMNLFCDVFSSKVSNGCLSQKIEINSQAIDSNLATILNQKLIKQLENAPVSCEFLRYADEITYAIASYYNSISPEIEKKKR